MPAAERKQLAHIIAETRTRTIIDETMADMWLDEPIPAPMAASMTARRDLVMTIGSMSKSFWGGLRIGWIRAERGTLATIAALRPSIDMGTASSNSSLPQAFSRLPTTYCRNVARPCADAATCCCALLSRVPARLAARSRPTGGMALWVRLPAPMSSALSAAASRTRSRDPAGSAIRCRRHAGTLHPRAIHACPKISSPKRSQLLARAWHTITGSTAAEPSAAIGRLVRRGSSTLRERSVDRVGGLDLAAGDPRG